MSPLSRDPEKREKQLSNLQPGRGPKWRPGAAPALVHGLRTRQPAAEEVEPVLAAVVEELRVKLPAPLVDEQGSVLKWAQESVWSLAVLKLGIVRCQRYLSQYGETDEHGRWRSENEALGKAVERYRRALNDEAMTLRSALRAGLDVKRGQAIDLAAARARDLEAGE